VEAGGNGLQFKADAGVGSRIAGKVLRNHSWLGRTEIKTGAFECETVIIGSGTEASLPPKIHWTCNKQNAEPYSTDS